MKPSILFLEQQSWRAGAQRVLEEIIRALDQEFSTLVAFPEDGPFVEDLGKLGVETLFYPLGRYCSGPKSLRDMAVFPCRSARCALHLAEIVRGRHVRLIYINGPRCLWAGALAGRLTGVPTLFHLHLTLTRPADRLVAVLGVRQVTKIIACSGSAAAGLPQSGSALGRKLEVIYNPVRRWPSAPSPILPRLPVDRAESNSRAAARPVVGVVGRITRAKGQHVALGAIGELVRRGLSPLAVFVGATDRHNPADEAYLRALQQRSHSLGVTAHVWWAGYQENPGPFYQIFDVLVVPTTTSEGLPMVALEAMHCGVPVIGSDVRGITEIVRHGHNGFLVPPGDESALAARLEQVIADRQLRRCLSAGALATLNVVGEAAENSRFSIEGFGRAVRRVVSELCPSLPAAENEPALASGRL